ncbi:MAG: two-CW domain-containing protein [Thermodesulfobacteriota bacterium]
MKRKNCWEFMGCGRENETEGGVICPAAVSNGYHGVNRGRYAGRFCWAVSGTLCNGSIQGSFAEKLLTCVNCGFLKHVQDQEGSEFILSPKSFENKFGNSWRRG